MRNGSQPRRGARRSAPATADTEVREYTQSGATILAAPPAAVTRGCNDLWGGRRHGCTTEFSKSWFRASTARVCARGEPDAHHGVHVFFVAQNWRRARGRGPGTRRGTLEAVPRRPRRRVTGEGRPRHAHGGTLHPRAACGGVQEKSETAAAIRPGALQGSGRRHECPVQGRGARVRTPHAGDNGLTRTDFGPLAGTAYAASFTPPSQATRIANTARRWSCVPRRVSKSPAHVTSVKCARWSAEACGVVPATGPTP